MLVSKRMVLEFGRGNIMTKSNENDVALSLVDSNVQDFSYSDDSRECVADIDSSYKILYKGKYVGDVITRNLYRAEMLDSYDPDDAECEDNPEDYIDTEFDYPRKGEVVWCHVDRLDINPEWQNLGIGTALLQKYFRGATISPDNEGAKKLYARIGHPYSGNNDSAYYADVGYGVYEID